MRFYQVDKVTELCPGKYVEGVKCVSLDNDVFDQHFPGCPIYPGTLLIEGMAQLSGMFLEWSRQEMGCKPRRAVLTLVEKKTWIATQSGVTCGSDAFFPFGDNVERARKSGVQYIVEPGGSIRDDHVIATVDRYGMVLAFTGMRLFHH